MFNNLCKYGIKLLFAWFLMFEIHYKKNEFLAMSK